jgi:hypothetical protein
MRLAGPLLREKDGSAVCFSKRRKLVSKSV